MVLIYKYRNYSAYYRWPDVGRAMRAFSDLGSVFGTLMARAARPTVCGFSEGLNSYQIPMN